MSDGYEEDGEKLREAIRRAAEESDTPEYRDRISKIAKELDHSSGICGKTGKPYGRIDVYVNTLGKFGPLSGMIGTTIRCSECGYVFGYKGSVTFS